MPQRDCIYRGLKVASRPIAVYRCRKLGVDCTRAGGVDGLVSCATCEPPIRQPSAGYVPPEAAPEHPPEPPPLPPVGVVTFEPGPKAKPPGIIRKAANLAKAAVKHVATGSKKLAADEVAARLAVCESNVCEKFDPATVRCFHKKCGCFLKDKARWRSEDCPEGLWPSTE